MLEKNIAREQRKKRETWVGYYPRRTPTKKEKESRLDRKHKNRQTSSQLQWRGSYFPVFWQIS